jgi:hypothetical protein
MFQPIIYNLSSYTKEAALIARYNFLITQKPKSGNIAEKLAAQNVWKKDCEFLLAEIKSALEPQTARHIHALTKQEGDAFAVRLHDQHGLELLGFICLHRGEYAQLKCWAVQEFINGLAPSARAALYEAIVN